MNELKAPIGVFDSGVGGLSVLRALYHAFPNEDFIYLGDTARLPYGTKSPETVIQYSLSAADILVQRGIKALVVACNTASSVALPALQAAFPIPVMGVVEPGALACIQAIEKGRVLVLATESTTRWHAYRDAFAKLKAPFEVVEWSCPLFVALAEEGWTSGPLVKEIVHEVLKPVLNQSYDAVILGCTHYPLLQEVIASVIPNTLMIDSASSIVQAFGQLDSILSGQGKGQLSFLATDGLERFARMASRFMGLDLKHSEVALVGHDLLSTKNFAG